jgi:hypothetical protein
VGLEFGMTSKRNIFGPTGNLNAVYQLRVINTVWKYLYVSLVIELRFMSDVYEKR